MPWGRAPWVLSGPDSHTHTQGVQHSYGTGAQDHQPPGRAPQPKSTRAISAQQHEICFHGGVDLPVLSVLRKSSFASERPCQCCPPSGKATLPQRRPTNSTSPRETFHSSARENPAWPWGVHSTRKKKTTRKMKELRSDPHLNQQENSPSILF